MELITTEGEVKLEDDSRGRHGGGQQSVTAGKQVQRNELKICSGVVSGELPSSCCGESHDMLEPKSGDAAGEDELGIFETPDLVPIGKEHRNKRRSGCNGASTEGSSDGRQGKKKHRRRPSKKKRRWKPYFKLTWEEKKELDERESARASRVRAEMFAKGLPVAPYNTTQFLMEEHDREEPDLNTELGGRRSIGINLPEDIASEDDFFDAEEEEEDQGGSGSDGMGRPGQAGGEFLQRDFSETYERYHVETLQNMSKQELVKEYLELEKCMSRLEEENNWLRQVRKNSDTSAESTTADGAQRVRELEREVERLRAQNSALLLQHHQGGEQVLNGSKVGTDDMHGD